MIIIGCGRMGAGLAQTLTQRGHAVTVVDNDPTAFERLGPAFNGQTVAGVGFDRDVLLQAGIARADGLAAVTASDEANVVAARLARQVFHVPRVVARLYEPRKAEIYRRLGILTISTTTWGIQRIAELLAYSDLDVVLSLGGDGIDLVAVNVPPLLVGRAISEVTIRGEIHVVAVSRHGRTVLPTAGTTFQENDVIYLAVLAASADRLKTLLALTGGGAR
jgi:trk system potassium uptake protein TrkA